MRKLSIDLGTENEKLLHVALQSTLTDLIAFGLIVKQAHWNVIGVHFRPVHLHLDEIYAEIIEYVDSIAERLTALSMSPSGQAKAVAADTILEELTLGFLKDDDVVLNVTMVLKKLVDAIRARMETIEDADTVTADLFHQVVAGLEKHLWMLRSQTL